MAWLAGDRYEVLDIAEYARFKDSLVNARVKVRVLFTERSTPEGGSRPVGKEVLFVDDQGQRVVAYDVPDASFVTKGTITAVNRYNGEVFFEIKTPDGDRIISKAPTDKKLLLMKGHPAREKASESAAEPETFELVTLREEPLPAAPPPFVMPVRQFDPLPTIANAFDVGDRHLVTLSFDRYESTKYVDSTAKAFLAFDSKNPDVVDVRVMKYLPGKVEVPVTGKLTLRRDLYKDGTRVYETQEGQGMRLTIAGNGEITFVDGLNAFGTTAQFEGEVQRTARQWTKPADYVRRNQFQEIEVPATSGGEGQASVVFRNNNSLHLAVDGVGAPVELKMTNTGPSEGRIFENRTNGTEGYRVTVHDNGTMTVESGIDKGKYVVYHQKWRNEAQDRLRETERADELWEANYERQQQALREQNRQQQLAAQQRAQQPQATQSFHVPGLGSVTVGISIGSITVGPAQPVQQRSSGPAVYRLPDGTTVSISLGTPTIRVGNGQ